MTGQPKNALFGAVLTWRKVQRWGAPVGDTSMQQEFLERDCTARAVNLAAQPGDAHWRRNLGWRREADWTVDQGGQETRHLDQFGYNEAERSPASMLSGLVNLHPRRLGAAVATSPASGADLLTRGRVCPRHAFRQFVGQMPCLYQEAGGRGMCQYCGCL
jgi:hypothetical protein